MHVLDRTTFNRLFDALHHRGFDVIGPTVRDAAIVYDRIRSADDLPIGWRDEQQPGAYRLKKRTDQALFGFVVGPISWKKFLFPPSEKLWEASRGLRDIKAGDPQSLSQKVAFLGVRACELQAITIQDKVFLGGAYKDARYGIRRDNILIIAVNCTEPGGTCFCVSMNSGPKAESGYDLSLTEMIGEDGHYFLVRSGSVRGEEILKELPLRAADQAQSNREEKLLEKSRQSMGRTMDVLDIKELLYNNVEHPQWDKVAERCLACANCTMTCPTCFCSTVEDVTDLTGDHVERWRKWDSCFTMDFSYIHGGNVRPSTKGRYRQWMTHKLASWIDQFGSSGCVGCGRCVTWCPVGIDITEEVKAIRDNPSS